MDSIEPFLNERNLTLLRKTAKGWTSFVFIVQDFKGEKFALKVLRDKANRRKMAQSESAFLAKVNKLGIGPKLFFSDFEKNLVLMEFIEGKSFDEWLFSGISKEELLVFLKELFRQAKSLDKAGIDHGQLAGRGKNILVRKGMPVLIDFEKASETRKAHNGKVLESFLYRNKNSAVAKKVGEILGWEAEKFFEK